MSKELISQFADHLRAGGKSHSTVIAYTKDLEQLNASTEKVLTDLDDTDIVAAIGLMQETHGFTPKTVSRKINSFRTFFKYLQGQGHVTHNPAEAVSHPKVNSKAPRVLSAMEYLALREVSRNNTRLYTMIEVLLQTGMRIGELSRLKVKHIDTNVGHVHIEEFSTISPRRVPLTGKALQSLEIYIPTLEIDHDEHPLFPTRDGKHIIIRNIRSSIDRAMAKAGIEDACVNDLRNTFIVHQLRHGVPVDVIAEVVGHRSKTTTQKYLELLDQTYSPSGDSKLVEL